MGQLVGDGRAVVGDKSVSEFFFALFVREKGQSQEWIIVELAAAQVDAAAVDLIGGEQTLGDVVDGDWLPRRVNRHCRAKCLQLRQQPATKTAVEGDRFAGGVLGVFV